jgi:hypothetical protein
VLHRVGAHVIPDPVGVPGSGIEQTLHAIRGRFAGRLGQRPPVLANQGRQQATNIRTSTTPRLDPVEPVSDPPEQVIQPSDPRSKIVISQHKIDNLHDHDHKVLLEY